MTTYIIETRRKEGSPSNYVQDEVNGQAGGIMHAVVGERGWIWFASQDEVGDVEWGYGCPFHRLHTSTIQSIVETEDAITIETRNTYYILRAEKHD